MTWPALIQTIGQAERRLQVIDHRRTSSSSCSTWEIGVSGKMPCPRLKMCGRSARLDRMRPTAFSSAAPPAIKRERVEIALHRHVLRQAPRPPRPDRPSRRARSHRLRSRAHRRPACRRRPSGKPMIGTSGWRAFSAATIRRSARSPSARTGPATGCPPSCRTIARPRPRRDLARQIVDRHRDDRVDDLREGRRIAIGEAPRLGLVAAALARDHIGRDGPRDCRQSQQSRVRRADAPPLSPQSDRSAPAGPARARARPARHRPAAATGAAPRPPRSADPGRARTGSSGCRKTGSRRRSRSGGSAGA